MKKCTKIILGIAILLPLVYGVLFIGFILYFATVLVYRPDAASLFTAVFILHAAIVILSYALVFLCILHLFRTSEVP